jgi:hypothetical protein
LFLK